MILCGGLWYQDSTHLQDYRGPKPFSEPEASAVRDFFAEYAPPGSAKSTKRKYGGLNVAMNWHSYGQVINVPYSHMASGEPPADDYEVFKNLAKRFVGSNNFKYGQAWAGNGLYTVNGDAADYMYDMHGTYAFSPEVGPFFDFEPFARGMWPLQKDIIPIVNESLAMSGQSVWANDVLPTLVVENSVLKARLPEDEEDDARTLFVQVAVSNGGVVDSDSPVVVSATFADDLHDIEAAYTQVTQPATKRSVRRAAGQGAGSCPIPLHSASDRVLNDDFTHFKADTGRVLSSSQDRTASTLGQPQQQESNAESAGSQASTQAPSELAKRAARARSLKQQGAPATTAVRRSLHGPDGLAHPDPRVVRSGGRLALTATVQGTVPPAGRATISLPFCIMGKGDITATLGQCSTRKAVKAAADSLPGGAAKSHPATAYVFLSDAHTCSVFRLEVAFKQANGQASSSTQFNMHPLRLPSGCSHCGAMRYAAAHDFAMVSAGDTAFWPQGLPSSQSSPAQECGGQWASPLVTGRGHVLLDGQAVEAAALLKCARQASQLESLVNHASAPAVSPLASPVGQPSGDNSAGSTPSTKPGSSPSSAPQATSHPKPSRAADASPLAPAVPQAVLDQLAAEQRADEQAVAIGTTAWTLTGVLLGVVLIIALMMALPRGGGPAPQQVFAALERQDRATPSHLARSGF